MDFTHPLAIHADNDPRRGTDGHGATGQHYQGGNLNEGSDRVVGEINGIKAPLGSEPGTDEFGRPAP